jgi:hypothetical protein
MDKLTQYRNYVQQLITEYAKYRPAYGDIEVETFFDTQRDHYQLVNIGGMMNNVFMVAPYILTSNKAKFGSNTMALKITLPKN